MNNNQDDQTLLARLETVEGMLVLLLKEVRSLKEIAARPDPSPSAAVAEGRKNEIVEGDRVKILSSDKYHNRKGEVIGRHGKMFWNVRLDKTPKETMSQIIYRSDGNLQKIPLK